jgi:putative cardiolipin synthase
LKSCNSFCIKTFFIASLSLLHGCASLPVDVERTPSHTLQDTQDTVLANKVSVAVAEHPGLSGFYPLSTGMDAFITRYALIDQAQRSLDVQYYIWHQDTTGVVLVDKLLQAADRGVRVRILLDDLDTAGKDSGLMSLDAHPNIEIRLYNPFASRNSRMMDFVTDLTRVNRRMHNKSLTADNQATIVGGRNIGNEYFGATSHAEFSDLDVLGIGPIVQDVSDMFDSYWNSDSVMPVRAFNQGQPITDEALVKARVEFDKAVSKELADPYIQAVKQSPLASSNRYDDMIFHWGRATLISDASDKAKATEVRADTHLAPKLKVHLDKAQQELIIISPYFVPGDELVDYLGMLVEKGVRVRILTNSLAANDVGVVHAGYMRYREALLRQGVELYEFKSVPGEASKEENKHWMGSSNASLHAKTFGIDREKVFVGSFNLDPRSVVLNSEMGVLIDNADLGAMLGQSFDNNIAHKAYKLELNFIPEDESDSGFDEYEIQWLTQQDGKTVFYDAEPDTSFWQRFAAGFLSIFVIESFL